MVEQWSKPNASVECRFTHYGVVTPYNLRIVLANPMKIFVVRFFDDSSRSMESHYMWNDLITKIQKDQLLRNIGTFQINCVAHPDYCKEKKIKETPELLVFNDEKVVSYFTQKFEISEMSEENMLFFVEDLGAINPLRKHVVPPPVDLAACCDALIVAGDDIRGNGDGVYRKQLDTKFGHVHYIQDDRSAEIFFEKNEFNIGSPYSSSSDRLKMRTESIMKSIYKDLGRSPCPDELAFWKYRASDFDEWDYDRDIQLHCTTQTELDKIGNVTEHTTDQSVDVSNPLLTPLLADLDPTYTDEDNCASFINIQGAMLPLGRGGGDFYKISEKYNGFVTYFHEETAATNATAALGYYLYYRKYRDFTGWVIGERTTFNSSHSHARLYAADGSYRLFARIAAPNLEIDSYIEACPCRLREEDYWQLRLPSQDNWVRRIEEGWYMGFGGNTNFDISISCASSPAEQLETTRRRRAEAAETKTLSTGQVVPKNYTGPTPPPVAKFEELDMLFIQSQEKLRQLGATLSARMDDFDARFDANTQSLVKKADADLAYVKKKIPEMKLNMDPGSAVGVDGSYLQPAPWTMSSRAAAKSKDTWGADIGDSKKPMFEKTTLGKMMINDCYRSGSFVDHRGATSFSSKANLATGNGFLQTSFKDARFMKQTDGNFLYDENTWKQQSVGKETSCPLADSILNKCHKIIDASQYIGVTFDASGPYS